MKMLSRHHQMAEFAQLDGHESGSGTWAVARVRTQRMGCVCKGWRMGERSAIVHNVGDHGTIEVALVLWFLWFRSGDVVLFCFFAAEEKTTRCTGR